MTENTDLLLYKLQHSSPEYIYGWLEENALCHSEYNGNAEDRENLENKLLEVKHPLVNLGLAKYGYEGSTGAKLYKTGDASIKKAVLSGSTIRRVIFDNWLIKNEVIENLLKQKNSDNLASLLSNPFIDDDLLVALFKRKSPFDNLDSDDFLMLISYASQNPRLTEEYKSIWMDGGAEYDYNLVFTSAWKLFESLDVNVKSAAVLSRLAEKLVAEAPHDMDVATAIERWVTKVDDTKKVDSFGFARSSLAKLYRVNSKEFRELKNSPDKALRASYYSRFSAKDSEEIREAFEKDGEVFLDAATGNKNLFKTEEVREALSRCCWNQDDPHSRMDYPNYFNSFEAHMKKENPEWFYEADITSDLEEIEDDEDNFELKVLKNFSQLRSLLQAQETGKKTVFWVILAIVIGFTIGRL